MREAKSSRAGLSEPQASVTRLAPSRRASPTGGHPVLALQRAIGNRAAATLLQRAPTGGVETTEVSPAVAQQLKEQKIPYATEVTFEVLGANDTPVVSGRADYVYRHPSNHKLIFVETKGLDLKALTTGQKIYVPMFQNGSVRIRITSGKGAPIDLLKASVEVVEPQNFMLVGRSNLTSFVEALKEMTTGKRLKVKYSFRDDSGAWFFEGSEDGRREFDAFLQTRGLDPYGKPLSQSGPGEHPQGGGTGPASAPTEPASATEKPGSAPKGGGTTGGLVGFIAPLLFGLVHESARAARIKKEAGEHGYAPPGAGATALDAIGDFLFNPIGEANFPMGRRLNIPKWRQRLREEFSGHKPGDTVVFRWDYYKWDQLHMFQDVTEHWFVYMLADDGSWFPYKRATDEAAATALSNTLLPQTREAAAKDPEPISVTPFVGSAPSIDELISPDVPDSEIEVRLNNAGRIMA